MKRILEKLFCKHKWTTHAKEVYKYTGKEVVEGTKDWYHPVIELQEFQHTDEVLICSECGKIKQIRY